MNTMSKTQEVKSNIVDISFRNTTMSNTTEETKKEKNITPKTLQQLVQPIRNINDIRKCEQYFLNKQEYRNNAIFICGIAFGLRASDLLSLKIKDVLNNDKNTFKKSFMLIEKKTKKKNTILITNIVIDALELYFCSLEDFDLNDYLFKSRKGTNEPIKVRSLWKILNTMANDLCFDFNIGTHSLRKTFGYTIISQNKDNAEILISLQQLFKHSSPEITLRYTGVEEDKLNELRNNLSNYLKY